MYFVCREVEWYVTQSVLNPATGEHMTIAMGPLCKVDGYTCEIWPLIDDKQVIIDKIQAGTGKHFCSTYFTYRVAVASTLVQIEARESQVLRGQDAGFRVVRKVAFVHKSDYKLRMKGAEPGMPGCSAPLICLPFRARQGCRRDFHGGSGL